MAKSQVKWSNTTKIKPPSQRGNGGSIIVFTHRCCWRLCRGSRTKRNLAAQCGTQKCRSEPYQPTPTRWFNSYIRWSLVPSGGEIQSILPLSFQDLGTIWEPATSFCFLTNHTRLNASLRMAHRANNEL